MSFFLYQTKTSKGHLHTTWKWKKVGLLQLCNDSVINKKKVLFRHAYVSPLLWLYTHKSKVGFDDGAILEAAVSPCSCCLTEGDTKSPAGGEIQLMTKPEDDRDNETTTTDHLEADSLIFGVTLTWTRSRCWGLPAGGSAAWAAPALLASRTTSCCQCGRPSACSRRWSHRSGAAHSGSPGWLALWPLCAAVTNTCTPTKTRQCFLFVFTIKQGSCCWFCYKNAPVLE